MPGVLITSQRARATSRPLEETIQARRVFPAKISGKKLFGKKPLTVLALRDFLPQITLVII